MKSSLLKNIREILLYNTWANERLIQNISLVKYDDYIKTLSVPFNNLHGLLAHLHYYDVKYYHKIVDGTAPKLDEKLPRASIIENILIYSTKWNEWISSLITNTSDPSSLENISENIFDLCIHNNYHRGQINILMSFLGYEPQSLDLFLYKTQQSNLNQVVGS